MSPAFLDAELRRLNTEAEYGCGSKLSHQETAGFSLGFHLPGQAILGVILFLTHSHMKQSQRFVFLDRSGQELIRVKLWLDTPGILINPHKVGVCFC